jgi:class 3 adenylate cyclase
MYSLTLNKAAPYLIPNAKIVELPGMDHLVFVGEEADQILSDIAEFLTGSKAELVVDRALAAVVFTDIVGSTARAQELGDAAWQKKLDDHNRIVRGELKRFRGS